MASLTDNVFANRIMSVPLTFAFYLGIQDKTVISIIEDPLVDLPFLSADLNHSLLFFIVFFYASRFFSPDLDSTPLRPGMSNFPFTKPVMDISIIKIKNTHINVRTLAYPINRIWYYMWEPYARLLTHRGISHWPIVGVLSRIGYLYIIAFLLSPILGLGEIKLDLANQLSVFTQYKPSAVFMTVVLPIYVSDIAHFIVDFYDSAKKGDKFCSNGIPRGLISKIIGITV